MIKVAGKHAYIIYRADWWGYDKGLDIIDMTNPNNPSKAGSILFDEKVTVNTYEIFGDYLLVAYKKGSAYPWAFIVDIYNIAQAGSPNKVASIEAEHPVNRMAIVENRLFFHKL